MLLWMNFFLFCFYVFLKNFFNHFLSAAISLLFYLKCPLLVSLRFSEMKFENSGGQDMYQNCYSFSISNCREDISYVFSLEICLENIMLNIETTPVILLWVLFNPFSYLGCSISSTESDINMHPAKASTAIDRLSIIWKSDLSHILKR